MRLASALFFLVVSWPRAACAEPPATQPAALPPQAERVLKYVPDDARLVVVVPSVDALATGLSAFGTAAGIPELADLTARRVLEKSLDKSATALDTGGPLVLALSAGQDEPILIASLASEESWKAATQPSALGNDVLVYEFGPDRLIAASTGGVALFARERGDLRRGLDATGQFAPRFAAAVGPWLAERQAVVYVDVTAWREELDTGISLAAQRIPGGMTMAGPDAEAGLQMFNWMLEGVKRLVLETRTFVASTRVDARGVLLDSRATFVPDSGVARYLAQVRRPQRDLLRGLPAGAGPVVMSYEWEEEPGAEGFSSTMTRALLGMESLKEKLGAEQLEAVVKQSIDLNRKVPGTSAVFGFGPAGKGVLYWGLYLTREGDAVRRDVRKICELTPELLGAWGAFPAAMTPRAPEEVGGVTADVYELKIEADASPRQPVVEALYGKEPMLLMAPHPEGVAYAFGPSEDARQKLAGLLKPDSAPLSQDPHVTDLFKVLTPNPQLCVLADIPGLLTSVTGILEQFGLPIPSLEVSGGDTPWAGFTFYLDPATPRIEFFMPAAPIKTISKAVRELEGKPDEAY
jgi:hypothetical protein